MFAECTGPVAAVFGSTECSGPMVESFRLTAFIYTAIYYNAKQVVTLVISRLTYVGLRAE